MLYSGTDLESYITKYTVIRRLHQIDQSPKFGDFIPD